MGAASVNTSVEIFTGAQTCTTSYTTEEKWIHLPQQLLTCPELPILCEW